MISRHLFKLNNVEILLIFNTEKKFVRLSKVRRIFSQRSFIQMILRHLFKLDSAYLDDRTLFWRIKNSLRYLHVRKLMKLLKNSPDPRVVMVSSTLLKGGTVDIDNLGSPDQDRYKTTIHSSTLKCFTTTLTSVSRITQPHFEPFNATFNPELLIWTV